MGSSPCKSIPDIRQCVNMFVQQHLIEFVRMYQGTKSSTNVYSATYFLKNVARKFDPLSCSNPTDS